LRYLTLSDAPHADPASLRQRQTCERLRCGATCPLDMNWHTTEPQANFQNPTCAQHKRASHPARSYYVICRCESLSSRAIYLYRSRYTYIALLAHPARQRASRNLVVPRPPPPPHSHRRPKLKRLTWVSPCLQIDRTCCTVPSSQHATDRPQRLPLTQHTHEVIYTGKTERPRTHKTTQSARLPNSPLGK